MAIQSGQQLQGSDHYIWSLAEPLGHGSAASVYKGRHKKNGDLCAVKVFKNLPRIGSDKWQGEIEILCKLKHPNIIQLLSVEIERTTKSHVVIMEICQTSLQGMLDDPVYSKGFPEDEFLVALFHIGDGLKYLRENNIIHKDIKPGNIMKILDIDNSSIYKLTDFGAASMVTQESVLTSIAGAEEYLHPSLFSQIVMHQNVPGTIDPRVDLWSFGATFYHVATGMPPFRPYGGRSNKKDMYQMISGKRSGVISAYQKPGGGSVVYEEDFPDTCLLSASLKRQILPMFVGVIENSPNCWSFDRFFEYIKRLRKQETINIFDTTHSVNQVLYVEPEYRFRDLQEIISEEVGIAPGDQIIINSHGFPLTDYVKTEDAICTFPRSTKKMQFFVFSSRLIEKREPKIVPLPSPPSFKSPFEYVRDYDLALNCSSFGHYMKRIVSDTVDNQLLLGAAVSALRDNLKRVVLLTQEHLIALRLDHEAIDRQRDDLELHRFCLLTVYPNTPSSIPLDVARYIDAVQERFDVVATSNLSEVSRDVNRYTGNMDKIEKKLIPYIDLFEVSCKDGNCCVERIDFLLDYISKIGSRFRRDKNSTTHTYNDEQIHKMERFKLKERTVEISRIYQEHCHPNIVALHSRAYDEIKTLCVELGIVYHIQRDIEKNKQSLDSISAHLHSERIAESQSPIVNRMVDIGQDIARDYRAIQAGIAKLTDKLESMQRR